jgi:RND family efflux transporter MFP subunit
VNRRCCYFLPWLLVLAGCGQQPDAAEEPVRAEVQVMNVAQGSLPDSLSAYGMAIPSPSAKTTLNVQAPGVVAHLDVSPGLAVKRGQHLLVLTLTPTAVAAYRQAQSAVRVADEARTHTAQLLAQQLATRDQVNQANKTASDARANLDALRQQQGDGSTVNIDAPFDGVVESVSVAQGDALQAGAPLLVLIRPEQVIVRVGVELDALDHVAAGDNVTLTPLGGGPSITGNVVRIAKALDPHTHQLDVDIVADKPIVGGAGFRADIVVGRLQGWLVPRDALVGDDQDWQVYQVASDKAVRVPVKVLGEQGDKSVVAGSLDAGRPLVTVGATQLDDGMIVHVMAPRAAQ